MCYRHYSQRQPQDLIVIRLAHRRSQPWGTKWHAQETPSLSTEDFAMKKATFSLESCSKHFQILFPSSVASASSNAVLTSHLIMCSRPTANRLPVKRVTAVLQDDVQQVDLSA